MKFKDVINESKGKWNLDDVSKNGSVPSFTKDGIKVKFDFDNKKQKYTYNARLLSGVVYGDIPEKYNDAFDEANINIMTKVANMILDKKKL